MGKLTPQKVVIVAGTDAYPKGYHEGNPGGLDAVDTDLATASIKSGINIFGKAGSTDVRDSTDADLIVGEAPTGKTFYAGGGARKTGNGTKTLDPANETVNAGYYAATTLSAVDGDLAAGNIKQGVNIFGKDGTVVEGGVETIEKYANASLVDDATYTPSDPGIFFVKLIGFQLFQYQSTGGWYTVAGLSPNHRQGMAISDGTNFRLKNVLGSTAEYIMFRHYMSSGTYERIRDEELAASTAWTPGVGGYFADGAETGQVRIEYNYATAGWTSVDEVYGNEIVAIPIGDGTELRVYNNSGSAYWHCTMRAVMT